MNCKDILKNIQKNSSVSSFVVDIGSSTGVNTDPAYQFIIDKEYKGLCIEGNPKCESVLRSKIAPTFDICISYITPENALEIFEKYKVPFDLDFLKIDIDGYDLEVLRVLLTKYRPKIIIAEINEKIPPPVLFEIPYKKDYSWDNSHLFGFSIQSGDQVMKKYNYTVVSIYELNNIMCMANEFVNTSSIPSVDQLYQMQYVNCQYRLQALPWNIDVDYWTQIKNKKSLCDEIAYYFEEKNKVKNVDFLIDIL
jgi:hypothetical protein